MKSEQQRAVAWLSGHPAEGASVQRLDPITGVLHVELHDKLRAQDFDALADKADSWVAEHGHLQGLVIHARKFPGWEDVGALLRHLRFVRAHRRAVRRIALAVGGLVPEPLGRRGDTHEHGDQALRLQPDRGGLGLDERLARRGVN